MLSLSANESAQLLQKHIQEIEVSNEQKTHMFSAFQKFSAQLTLYALGAG